MEGATIGAYHIVRKLGEGGMGTVYLAEHALLGRTAAVKVLLPMFSANPEIVTRFFNEARAVTRVSDPGIVQLFDFGYHTDGSAYLVMELLDGESLDARLGRVGKLAPLEAVRLMRQCASSLATAHARGIIHRDLKPENLFVIGDPAVTGGERIKILDFGVAKLSGDGIAGVSKTRTGMIVGTPIYMSPEQCRGAGDIDARSDIYSLGCVMFALVTGRPPFCYDSSGELIAAHLRERPPSLVGHVPAELDAVIQACLAKSPGDRYPSMTAVVEALDRVAGQVWYAAPIPTPAPIAVVPPPAVTTLRGATGEAQSIVETPRRRRAIVIATVASVCIAAAIVVVVATHAPSVEPVASSTPERSPAPPPSSVVAPLAQPIPADAATAMVPSVDAGTTVAPIADGRAGSNDATHAAVRTPPPHDIAKHTHAHAPPTPPKPRLPDDDHTKPTSSGSAVIDRGD